MFQLTARTRVAGVIGDPVHHSLSPELHNAAYTAMRLDWVYVALPVAAGGGGAAVEAMRSLGLAGLSVTMPHKAAVAGAVDRLSPTGRRLGAVNTVSWSDGELAGDSTDGAGLLDALYRDHHWTPAGLTCGVLGTGGAARAVVIALADAGAERVLVAGRNARRAAEAAALAGAGGAVVAPRQAAGATLVVNATPVGMGGGPSRIPFGIDGSTFGPGQLVVDLVYTPPVTPLLAAAAAGGATVANGLGMLVHQAARQIELWTGAEAPREVMAAAAASALRRREQAGADAGRGQPDPSGT